MPYCLLLLFGGRSLNSRIFIFAGAQQCCGCWWIAPSTEMGATKNNDRQNGAGRGEANNVTASLLSWWLAFQTPSQSRKRVKFAAKQTNTFTCQRFQGLGTKKATGRGGRSDGTRMNQLWKVTNISMTPGGFDKHEKKKESIDI